MIGRRAGHPAGINPRPDGPSVPKPAKDESEKPGSCRQRLAAIAARAISWPVRSTTGRTTPTVFVRPRRSIRGRRTLLLLWGRRAVGLNEKPRPRETTMNETMRLALAGLVAMTLSGAASADAPKADA